MVISSSHDAAIERALIRATARGLIAEHLGTIRDGYNVVSHYRVSSHSHPGTTHAVAVSYSGRGVETFCDCPCGQTDAAVCVHAAMALQSEGMSEPPAKPEPKAKLLTLADFARREAEADAYWG